MNKTTDDVVSELENWKLLNNGIALTLGLKVKVSKENEYWDEWQDVFEITGLTVDPKGRVDITIADIGGNYGTDGWSVTDVYALPANRQ